MKKSNGKIAASERGRVEAAQERCPVKNTSEPQAESRRASRCAEKPALRGRLWKKPGKRDRVNGKIGGTAERMFPSYYKGTGMRSFFT